jgi:hypothetical protein
MLRELDNVRQDPGARRRRWFTGDEVELVVWVEPEGSVSSFHLYLTTASEQRVVVWRRESGGLAYFEVDDGEGRAFSHKATPILRPSAFDGPEEFSAAFERECGELDPELADVVRRALADQP